MADGALPDLILVMTDQQRADQLGYSSSGKIHTPNLDRLATSGVTFANAYSASTTCVPARTALMTGLFDHRTHYVAENTLAADFFTVPNALRTAGYQTALIGKMHFTPIRTTHGFDHMRTCEHVNAYPFDLRDEPDHYHEWLQNQGVSDWRFDDADDEDGAPVATTFHHAIATHPTSWVRDQTLDFLEHRDPDKPLFLVVSFPHPHPPLNPPEPYASMYDPEQCVIDPAEVDFNAMLPGQFRRATEQLDAPHRRIDPNGLTARKAELARTWGLITQIDDAVGEIVGALDLSNALLWFTSDHGDYAGHRGLVRKIPWIPFDDLAKVPCFATGSVVDGSRTEASPMQSFDFATTCLDLAGIDVDLSAFDGVSQRAFLADPDGSLPTDRSVITGISMRWPMVRRAQHKYLREMGWGSEALFDVERDPAERLNLFFMDPDRTMLDEFYGVITESMDKGIPDLPTFPPNGIARPTI